MPEKHSQMDLGEFVKIPGGRGGRREGAGRKGNGWEVRRVALSLPPAMWQAIDKESDSTAEAIRKLLEKAVPAEPRVQVTPLGEIPPINLKSAFYGRSVDFILDWMSQLVPVTDFDRQNYVTWDNAVHFVSEQYVKEEHRDVIHERLLSDFPEGCALGPAKVEEALSCTKTERKRLEQEGRLIVVTHFNAGSKRNPVWVPMYDRRVIKSLSAETIVQWRLDHETAKAMNRREKDKGSMVRSRHVMIEAYQEGKRPYRIFGPVRADSESIEELWTKHKDKLPWDWEGSAVVQLKDFHTGEILKMSMHSI